MIQEVLDFIDALRQKDKKTIAAVVLYLAIIIISRFYQPWGTDNYDFLPNVPGIELLFLGVSEMAELFQYIISNCRDSDMVILPMLVLGGFLGVYQINSPKLFGTNRIALFLGYNAGCFVICLILHHVFIKDLISLTSGQLLGLSPLFSIFCLIFPIFYLINMYVGGAECFHFSLYLWLAYGINFLFSKLAPQGVLMIALQIGMWIVAILAVLIIENLIMHFLYDFMTDSDTGEHPNKYMYVLLDMNSGDGHFARISAIVFYLVGTAALYICFQYPDPV